MAEFIFFIPAIIKIIWFPGYHPGSTLTEWHRFYALSALSLCPGAPADYSYALQTLNLFEVGYWFLLGYGVSKATSLNYDLSLRLVVVSYLPLLFIWIALVTFSTLMLFPDAALS
jgi:hypothetical protein